MSADGGAFRFGSGITAGPFEHGRPGSGAANGPRRELVTVVIPAFNAEATIDETLRSVRSQSWRELEILVVDDGSSDGTAAVALDHAEQDPRVRVLRQPNLGVAAARNHGIAATSGRYVAPIDADDLWAPTKIERQMEAVENRDVPPGLVYTWFCRIDGNGAIQLHDDRGRAEGWVLDALCRRNLVGTGSGAMILRAALDSIGGYDPSLRSQGAEGSEDYDVYLRVAERYPYALVPDFLTGYRELGGNMSSDVDRMIRSRDLCTAAIAARHPELEPALREGRTRFLRFMIARAGRQGRLVIAARLFVQMIAQDPGGAAARIGELVRERRARGGRDHGIGAKRFEIGQLDAAAAAPPVAHAVSEAGSGRL